MKNVFHPKVVIVGDYGVNKTTLLQSVCGNFKSRERTLHQEQLELPVWSSVKKETLIMCFWDTCSQEKFRSLTASYYRGAHGALVLFDVTKESTFTNVNYWLHDLKEYSSHPDVSTILVGTKCHVDPEKREVSADRAQKFAESVGIHYMEVSAEEGKHVTEVFEKLADLIIERLSTDQSPNMTQPGRVILQDTQRAKKQWCSC